MVDLGLLTFAPADTQGVPGAARTDAKIADGGAAFGIVEAFATLVDALAPVTPAPIVPVNEEIAQPAADVAPPVSLPLLSVPPSELLPIVPSPATVQSGIAPDWTDFPVAPVKASESDDDDEVKSPTVMVTLVQIELAAPVPPPPAEVEPPVVRPAEKTESDLDSPAVRPAIDEPMEPPVFRSARYDAPNPPFVNPAASDEPVEPPVFRSAGSGAPTPPVARPASDEFVESSVVRVVDSPVVRPVESPVARPASNEPVESTVVRPMESPVFRPAMAIKHPLAPSVARPASNQSLEPPVARPAGNTQPPAPATTPSTPLEILEAEIDDQLAAKLLARTEGTTPRVAKPAAEPPPQQTNTIKTPTPSPNLAPAAAKPIAAALEATIASLKLHAAKAFAAQDVDAEPLAGILRAQPLRQAAVARTVIADLPPNPDPLPATATWQFEPAVARLRTTMTPETARVIVTRGAASTDLLTAAATTMAPSTTTRATVFEVARPQVTAATSAAFTTAETLTNENVAHLVQSIRMQWTKGGGEAQIRLEPRQFGEVTVSVRVERDAVSVRLHAEAPEVREYLQAQQQVLRAGLAEHRLTLDRLEVSEPSRQQPSDSRDGQPSQPRQRRESRRHRPSDPNATFDLEA